MNPTLTTQNGVQGVQVGNQFTNAQYADPTILAAAKTGSTNQSSSSNPTSEPSVISTDNGKKVLQGAVDKHTADMTALTTSQNKNTTTTDTRSGTGGDAKAYAMKQVGGVTADEAQAAGIDLSEYKYDQGSGYFLPSNGTTSDQDQYTADKQSINDAFGAQISGMDSATRSLIDSIKGIYDSRISAQQDVNKRELQGFNTMNVRNGTDRYAGGVAQSILTADENAGLDRIRAIAAEESNKIAEANQNLQEKKYSAFMDSRKAVDDLRKERNATLQHLHDQAIQSVKDERNYKLDVQKFQEQTKRDEADMTLAERKQNQQEKMDAFERAYKTEDLKIKKMNSPLGLDGDGNSVRQVVALDGSGKPVTADQQTFLSALPPATATMIKSLTDYSMDPKNLSTKNGSRQTILALAHQYDPTFNENNYATASKVKQEYTSGATAKNIQALNTSVNHIGDLAGNFKNLPNSDITKFNSLKDWYSQNSGKGDVTKVVTDLNAVAGELAKTFKGTGATDQEVSAIEKGINVNSSPAQFKAFIEETTKLLGGRLNALNDSYQTSVGKPFERPFLSPGTSSLLSQLKNNGYNIEVPGVLYTDPKAYVKFDKTGTSNLKTVISTYPNLSQADALQLAQSLND